MQQIFHNHSSWQMMTLVSRRRAGIIREIKRAAWPEFSFLLLAAEEWAASELRGVFTVKYKSDLFFGKIRGVFPSMQRRIIFFHGFESNKGNFSLYLSCFQHYF
ncbi:hypothetical protein [Bacillus infantis]|uniref:hypothetical protein n=1 Tax=Bacillus infantis TaxID=324767 RepID=UPI003CEF2090